MTTRPDESLRALQDAADEHGAKLEGLLAEKEKAHDSMLECIKRGDHKGADRAEIHLDQLDGKITRWHLKAAMLNDELKAAALANRQVKGEIALEAIEAKWQDITQTHREVIDAVMALRAKIEAAIDPAVGGLFWRALEHHASPASLPRLDNLAIAIADLEAAKKAYQDWLDGITASSHRCREIHHERMRRGTSHFDEFNELWQWIADNPPEELPRLELKDLAENSFAGFLVPGGPLLVHLVAGSKGTVVVG